MLGNSTLSLMEWGGGGKDISHFCLSHQGWDGLLPTYTAVISRSNALGGKEQENDLLWLKVL